MFINNSLKKCNGKQIFTSDNVKQIKLSLK